MAGEVIILIVSLNIRLAVGTSPFVWCRLMIVTLELSEDMDSVTVNSADNFINKSVSVIMFVLIFCTNIHFYRLWNRIYYPIRPFAL